MSTDDYLKKYISPEHRDKPKFTAWLSAALQIIVDMQNFLSTLYTYFDLDTAIGNQLDILGEYLGCTRMLPFQPALSVSPVKNLLHLVPGSVEIEQPTQLINDSDNFSIGTSSNGESISVVENSTIGIKFQGSTAANVLNNNDFIFGADYWESDNNIAVGSDTGGTYLSITAKLMEEYLIFYQLGLVPHGHRMFIMAQIWLDDVDNISAIISNGSTPVTVVGTLAPASYVKIYTVVDSSDFAFRVNFNGIYPDQELRVRNTIAIDMGADSSNPLYNLTAAQMYNLYPDFFNGQQNLSGVSFKSESQKIQNGDFSNGTTGWSEYGASAPVVSNQNATFTFNEQWGTFYQDVNFIEGHKYYVRVIVSGGPDVYLESNGNFAYCTITGSEALQFVFTYLPSAGDSQIRIVSSASSGWTPTTVYGGNNGAICIDMGSDSSNPLYNLTAAQMLARFPNSIPYVSSTLSINDTFVSGDTFSYDNLSGAAYHNDQPIQVAGALIAYPFGTITVTHTGYLPPATYIYGGLVCSVSDDGIVTLKGCVGNLSDSLILAPVLSTSRNFAWDTEDDIWGGWDEGIWGSGEPFGNDLVPLDASTDYTLSLNQTGTITGAGFAFYLKSGSQNLFRSLSSANFATDTETIPVAESITSIGIEMAQGQIFQNFVLKPQLEKGDKATGWEPYYKLFAWDTEDDDYAGWDEGAWAATDLTAVANDDIYRLILRARIAEAHFDGTVPSILQIFQTIFGKTGIVFFISDNQNMSCALTVFGATDSITRDLIMGGYVVPRPEGVNMSVQIPSTKVMAWDIQDKNWGGWDNGYWLPTQGGN